MTNEYLNNVFLGAVSISKYPKISFCEINISKNIIGIIYHFENLKMVNTKVNRKITTQPKTDAL